MSNSTGNFTQLSQEISNTDDSFDLATDYTQNLNESSIDLYKSITINGNNHNMDSKNKNSSMFKLYNNTNIVFKDIYFMNSNLFSADNSTGNITIFLINCSFMPENITPYEINYYGYDWGYGVSCEISPEVRSLAYEIIGQSTDLEAAKKIVAWVKKNIKYDYDYGFYQSPDDTLHRKRGNCCCRTDLVIHMMVAVGLAENHEICYIHVGTKQYKSRHFFGMIDNICFDIGTTNPWGHGKFHGRPATVTPYQILPLPYGRYG